MDQSGKRGADQLSGNFALAQWLELWHQQSEDFAVLFMALDATVVATNDAVTRILGYAPSELIGATLRHIFTEEDLRRGLDVHELEVAATLGRAEDDRWHIGKGGRRVWISGVLVPLRNSQGQHIGFAKLLRDRTDLHTEIVTLENRLAQANATASRKNEFLATLGHELRNPLHTLVSAFEVLKQTADPDKKEKMYPLVERQLSFFSRMLDDLRDATRVDVGALRLALVPLNLQEAIRGAIALHEATVKARSQQLQWIFPEPEIVVLADSIRLEQIIRNLLDNASKYTPEGGHISVTATVEGQMAVMRVVDDGIGLSASVLPAIFDLFTREDRAIDSAADGLGIGLALVKNLVELHHGIIQVQSGGPDQGSEFTVMLPLASPTDSV